MAAPVKKPAAGAKAGAGKPKSKGPSISKLYDVSGARVARKNKFCPKCGPGYFMAIHSTRIVCGKCAYTEFVKK